jgi:hypothetical protein
MWKEGAISRFAAKSVRVGRIARSLRSTTGQTRPIKTDIFRRQRGDEGFL